MALFAFLPWFDFRSFSISGIDLPGQEGEILLLTGILITGIGIAAPAPRFGPLPILLLGFLGVAAFAITTRQIFTYWQAGSCGWEGTAPPGRDFVCRDTSSVLWHVDGSPAEALWAATGLSAFVSLLAGWRLFARPAPSEPETPTEISEAWS
jgi:hypothetical protein